jgi:hypothetical protein
MAPVLRDSAFAVGGTSGTTSTASLTGLDVIPGALVVVYASSERGALADIQTPTCSDGAFTQYATAEDTTSGNFGKLFYRQITSTTSTNFTVTTTNTTAAAAQKTHYATALVFTNHNGLGNSASAVTAGTAPSVTADASDDVLVVGLGLENNITNPTIPSMTRISVITDASTLGSHAVFTEQLAASGATGTRTRNDGGSGTGVSISVIVKAIVTTTSKSGTESPVATITDTSSVNRSFQWKADETQATNVAAGFVNSGSQRQNGAGTFNDTTVAWPINYVTAPYNRPGKALNFTIPENYRRYETVPSHSDFYPGDTFFFGTAFALDANFPLDANDYQIFDQIHQAWGSWSPPVALEIRNNELRVTGGNGLIRSISATDPIDTWSYSISLMPLSKETWYNVVYKISNFSMQPSTSTLDIWVNGTQVLTNHTILPPTIVQGDAAGIGSYRKCGIYHRESLPALTIYESGHATGLTYAYVDPYKELLQTTKTGSDSITITESATVNVSQTRTDSIAITDTRTELLVSRLVSDNISITDASIAFAALAGSDSLTVTDSTIELFQGFPKDGADLISVVDQFQSIVASQTRSETLTITDTAAVFSPRAVSDSITITESSRLVILSSDTVAFNDTVKPTSSVWQTRTDQINIIDGFQGFFTFSSSDHIATIYDQSQFQFEEDVLEQDIILYRDPELTKNFRIIAQNIFTKEFIHWNLPLTNPRISYKLTAPNVFKAEIRTEMESIMNLDPPLVEHATWLHVEENGQIRGSFILEPFVDENGNQKRQIEGIGFSDYLNWVHYQGEEYKGIQVDPANILRKLWAEAQKYEDGKLGVILNPDTTTPVKLGTESKDVEFETGQGENVSFEAGPYDLNWWEVTNLGTAAKKLFKDTPMEYIERSYWNEYKTDVIHYLDFRYPRTGAKRDDLIFRQGENMSEPIPKIYKTQESLSTDFIFVGAGEGRTAVRANVSRRTGRLRRTHVVQNEDVKDINLAKSIITFEANRITRGGTIIDKAVVNTEHINAPWGSFEQGDDIYLEGHVAFYGQVRGYYRIVAYDYDRRTRRATLDLAPSDSFSYGVY